MTPLLACVLVAPLLLAPPDALEVLLARDEEPRELLPPLLDMDTMPLLPEAVPPVLEELESSSVPGSQFTQPVLTTSHTAGTTTRIRRTGMGALKGQLREGKKPYRQMM